MWVSSECYSVFLQIISMISYNVEISHNSKIEMKGQKIIISELRFIQQFLAFGIFCPRRFSEMTQNLGFGFGSETNFGRNRNLKISITNY